MKQLTPSQKEFRRKLVKAIFPELRKKNFVIRANYMCCTDCATKAVVNLITIQEKKGAVYWSRQEENMMRDGYTKLNYMPSEDNPEAWQSVADTVLLAVRKHGLVTEWSGILKDPVVVKNELIPDFKPVKEVQELLLDTSEVLVKIRQQKAQLALEMASLASKENEMSKSMNQNREVLKKAFEKYESKALKVEATHGANAQGRETPVA